MRFILKYTWFAVLLILIHQLKKFCKANTFVKDGGTTAYAIDGKFDPISQITKKNSRILYENFRKSYANINHSQIQDHVYLSELLYVGSVQPPHDIHSNTISSFSTLFPTKHCLSTMIHYGYADFTTTVGDSIIIFTPLMPNPSFGLQKQYKNETALHSINTIIDEKNDIHIKTLSNPHIYSSSVLRDRNVYDNGTYLTNIKQSYSLSHIIPSKVPLAANAQNFNLEVDSINEIKHEVRNKPKYLKNIVSSDNIIDQISVSKSMIRTRTYETYKKNYGNTQEMVNIDSSLKGRNEMLYKTMYTIFTYLTTYLKKPSSIHIQEDTNVNSQDIITTRSSNMTEYSKEIFTKFSLLTTYYHNTNSHIMSKITKLQRPIELNNNIEFAGYSRISQNLEMINSTRTVPRCDIDPANYLEYVTKNNTPNKDNVQNNDNVQLENTAIWNRCCEPSNNILSPEVAVLVLQTRYTTHTYFTTRYSGHDTNIASHLETSTGTMTEKFTSMGKISNTENFSPITYFTTFTFFTKISTKSKITTISRVEIVSNVIAPTNIFGNIGLSNTASVNTYSFVSEGFTKNDKYAKERAEYDTSKLRIKRETQRNRFRKPKPVIKVREEHRDADAASYVSMTPSQHTNISRNRANNNMVIPIHNTVSSKKRLIRPSRVSSIASERSKFTLRDKDPKTTTEKAAPRRNFRKPESNNSVKGRRPSSSLATLLAGKRRPTNQPKDESLTSASRNTVNSRRRNSNGVRPRMGSYRDSDSKSRSRISPEVNSEHLSADKNGIITVTHEIPVETFLPIVNGKSTEYKSIITARTSIQVLNPQQYTTILGSNGYSSLALISQSSSINVKGATEYTQFILQEIPTTFVTFTPTTIRGRRTSFSFIMPSTAYSVQNVVSTVQPNIQADTPLANILLSQLLLGNIGFPSNFFQGLYTESATQSTEYLTRTSTYLTTLYEGKSTVLPITFQGKKIYTTIYDTTAQTITATEYITDTIVITPTSSHLPMVNSLLIQQLLQPHNYSPIQFESLNSNENSVLQQSMTDHYSISHESVQYPENFNDEPKDDVVDNISIIEHSTTRKSGKKHKRKHKHEPLVDDSSVITLYVSGRRPGEFSTILSTIRPEHTLQKRSLSSTIEIHNFKGNIKTKLNLRTEGATQSLKSIVGNVNEWFIEHGQE